MTQKNEFPKTWLDVAIGVLALAIIALIAVATLH